MAISITTSEVKRKAMIPSSNTSYDSSISTLISEMQPVLEHSIEGAYLADEANSGQMATIKLGMLEIITGEFIEQLRREAGSCEEFSAAGISIGASCMRGSDLLQQGACRLMPYLKSTPPYILSTKSISTTTDFEPEFSRDEGVW